MWLKGEGGKRREREHGLQGKKDEHKLRDSRTASRGGGDGLRGRMWKRRGFPEVCVLSMVEEHYVIFPSTAGGSPSLWWWWLLRSRGIIHAGKK